MRRRRLRLLSDMLDLVEKQTETIQLLRVQHVARIERMQRENIDTQLSYSRIGRDLIEQFLIVLDQPECHDEVRGKLRASLVDFNDEVARLEEQTTGDLITSDNDHQLFG